MKTKRAVLVGVALVVSVGTQACTSVDAINGCPSRFGLAAGGDSPTR